MKPHPWWRLLLLSLMLWIGCAPASVLAGQIGPVAVSAAVPMYRGGPARTGENPGPGPRGTPVARWVAWLGFLISSSPAVVNGAVYIGSISPVVPEGGALHAVDAVTGEERWRLPTIPGDGIFSSPAVDNGLVYAGSYDGLVIAASTATGKERWRFAAGSPVIASPAVVAGVVYIGDLAGSFHALDAATGRQRWTFSLDRPYERGFSTSASVVNGTVYIVSSARRSARHNLLHALDTATGKERWHFTAQKGGDVRGIPVVAAGTIYVVTTKGVLYAVNARDGKERWHYASGAEVRWANPAVVAGTAYVATSDGVLHAVDARTGQRRWIRRLAPGVMLVSSPTVADGTVYLGDANGTLYAVEAASGRERWHQAVGSFLSSPAIVGGVIYVGGDDGKLRAFGNPPNGS